LAEALRLERGRPDEEVHRLRLGLVLRSCPRVLFSRDDPFVSTLRFSPDGSRVLIVTNESVGKPSRTHVLDAETGRPLFAPLVHEMQVGLAEFSPDGSRFFTLEWQIDNDGARLLPTASGVQVWSAADGRPLGRTVTAGEKAFLVQAQFHPDGRQLLLT